MAARSQTLGQHLDMILDAADDRVVIFVYLNDLQCKPPTARL